MANDLSARQWRLDTATPFGSPGALLWPGNVFIKQIIFEKYSAQASNATIKDRNGKIIFQPTGAADVSPVRSNELGWVEGFVLDTLSDGNIMVYVK